MNHSSVAVCLTAVVVVSACVGSENTRVSWGGVVDTLSSGRIVVHNPDAPVRSRPWILRERFRLGVFEGDSPDLFGHVGGLAIGGEGEVFVLDDQANEIRVFDDEGTFRSTIGREGPGPGELRSPGGLAFDSMGTLWVMNWGNARYSGFDPATGEIRREVRRRIAFATFPWTGAFESGAYLIDVGLNGDGASAVLRLDTAFIPHDTLTLPQASADDRITFTRSGVRIASMMEPFAPQPAWAPRPAGGIVVGEGSVYRLHRIGFDGDTSMTMELRREPVPVTAEERDSAMTAFREMAGSLGAVAPNRQPRARDSKPAHGLLFMDDEDRTWVRGAVPADQPAAWDVFGSDGRFLVQVAAPESAAFLRPVIRNRRMAVATLADGFPVVVVYDVVTDEP